MRPDPGPSPYPLADQTGIAMRITRAVTVLLLLVATASAQTSVTLSAVKDNTLFESATGTLSNGVGTGLFCGVTTSNLIRRGLIAFDVAAAVPPGSIIQSATLTLEVTQINTLNPLNLDIGLHRVLADWGEAGSNSNMVGGGGGAAAQFGDATWLHRFAPQQSWLTPGGDFAPAASALTTVGTSLGPVSWSGPGLAADVQLWLDSPGTAFGWMLKSPEEESNNAKRFATREHPTVAFRPELQIVFSSAPYPGSGEDLALATGVATAPDAMPIKQAFAGQLLSGLLDSPTGGYLGAPYVMAAQIAPAGMLPWQTQFYPEIHLDFSPNTYYDIVVLATAYGSPPTVLGLPLGGLLLSGAIPSGLEGFSLLIQGYAFTPSLQAANPWFTTTDAHEIQIN